MKIAAVTADGVSIHSHFGQAPFFEVLTIEDGQVTERVRRVKPAHGQQTGGKHHQAGTDVHAGQMAAVIADCQVVLARGMGEPAYEALRAAGLEPLLVREQTIDEAIEAYLRGELQHHPERMHRH